MIEAVSSADVIFFGELHDNPIAHWLEYEVTADLHKTTGDNLILGAEMFETDDQLLLNEYLSGKYEADKFEAEVKLWKNYKTDYKPLVGFARKNGLPFIATNIPRRYASMVSKGGFEVLDSLTAEAKALIAPLPISYDPELKCYKEYCYARYAGHRAGNQMRLSQSPGDQGCHNGPFHHWKPWAGPDFHSLQRRLSLGKLFGYNPLPEHVPARYQGGNHYNCSSG
ncbi:MAG: ChaN family lipoprotein [Bacteroidales bacterium]|nr:ChaN family lipoprotein [Bacteroidales bacterium]